MVPFFFFRNEPKNSKFITTVGEFFAEGEMSMKNPLGFWDYNI